MDTLGIDENNAPVVIEYKRASDENVINHELLVFVRVNLDHVG